MIFPLNLRASTLAARGRSTTVIDLARFVALLQGGWQISGGNLT
jgi:hypothetical protein